MVLTGQTVSYQWQTEFILYPGLRDSLRITHLDMSQLLALSEEVNFSCTFLCLCAYLWLLGRLSWCNGNALGFTSEEYKRSCWNSNSRLCGSVFLPKVKVCLPGKLKGEPPV